MSSGDPACSIFEAVCPRDDSARSASRILRPLLENFRMNDVLTSLAAELLYGPGDQVAEGAELLTLAA